ncbi:hypothetical protein [Eubacterium ventriosum]|mgnify:CR=1 FL=1|nr:hypothetical protein [Eubacterium ventriosum]MEE0855263.1 hypothetical protein [Eubacterium ventriosum]
MRETAEGCSNYEFIKYSYRPLGEDDSDNGKKNKLCFNVKAQLILI